MGSYSILYKLSIVAFLLAENLFVGTAGDGAINRKLYGQLPPAMREVVIGKVLQDQKTELEKIRDHAGEPRANTIRPSTLSFQKYRQRRLELGIAKTWAYLNKLKGQVSEI